MRPRLFALALTATTLIAAGCSGERQGDSPDVALGPADGAELAPADLERVAVGQTAPDFRLAALGGDIVGLSDFRGERDVVLVFYRGHW